MSDKLMSVARATENEAQRKTKDYNRLEAINADLLAALEGMVEDYQEAYGGGDLDEEPSALKQARAAIAKTKS